MGRKRVCFEFRDTGSCKFGDKCKFPHVQRTSPLAATPSRKTGSPKSSSPQSVASQETAELRGIVRELSVAMRETDKNINKIGEQIFQLTKYNAGRDADLELQARECVRHALVQQYQQVVEKSALRTFIKMDGSDAVEWDGVFLVRRADISRQQLQHILFLVEVKQKLSKDDIDRLEGRVATTKQCITDTTPLSPDMELPTLDKLMDQRALLKGERDIAVRAIIGGMNLTEDLKSYIVDKGHVAIYPNGANLSVTGV